MDSQGCGLENFSNYWDGGEEVEDNTQGVCSIVYVCKLHGWKWNYVGVYRIGEGRDMIALLGNFEECEWR